MFLISTIVNGEVSLRARSVIAMVTGEVPLFYMNYYFVPGKISPICKGKGALVTLAVLDFVVHCPLVRNKAAL